ncbi:hypothetical protein L614_002000000050 [Ochrobactrum sp. J50]|uniref:hypothetical protein n=1 Tax=Ochrobactrum sp. J50 TaxID=936132 RepID=UPI0011ADB3C4|nr:hypothetical protein [Ochrobactrum sp. J50]TWH01771.1 hypothetical protein L614_002000000050 [Ochrobactrum sp. J50]
MGATARRIDAAYLNALRLGPQRIGYPGIHLPVACRLEATGKARVLGNVVEVRP